MCLRKTDARRRLRKTDSRSVVCGGPRFYEENKDRVITKPCSHKNKTSIIMKTNSRISFCRHYHFVVIAVQSLCLFGKRVDSATIEQENNFKSVLKKMESDVLALRDEIERVYQYRCNLSTLDSCGNNNYNDCTSKYPNEECAVEDEFVIGCGGDLACKGKDGCVDQMKQTND